MSIMREVEIIKKTQIKLPKVKSKVAEMKNALDGINNRLDTKEKEIRDFWPTWRHKQTHSASSHYQNKDNNKFKNKQQPELPENRTVWKSDRRNIHPD